MIDRASTVMSIKKVVVSKMETTTPYGAMALSRHVDGTSIKLFFEKRLTATP